MPAAEAGNSAAGQPTAPVEPVTERTAMSYDGYEFLKPEVSDGILTVTMTSPETRNAVGASEWAEFGRVWRDVATDPSVGVIILTGAGKAFCSGGNLKKFAA